MRDQMKTSNFTKLTRRSLLASGVLCGLFGASSFARSFSVRGAEGDKESNSGVKKDDVPQVSFKLEKKIERDVESYTQGLLYELDPATKKGVLYESGGQYGRSLLRKVDAETCEVLKQIKIPSKYFAEGLAAVDDKLYLLTWRERTCLVYDKKTFEKVDEFRYRTEGWGLTYNGKSLVMSDGSSKIRFFNPSNFKLEKTIDVRFVDAKGKRRQLEYLNELEWINGEIWANVYQQEFIVRIDPTNGNVLGTAINFASLTPKSLKASQEYVLNGLAFDARQKKLFATGKCWPVLYQIAVDFQ